MLWQLWVNNTTRWAQSFIVFRSHTAQPLTASTSKDFLQTVWFCFVWTKDTEVIWVSIYQVSSVLTKLNHVLCYNLAWSFKLKDVFLPISSVHWLDYTGISDWVHSHTTVTFRCNRSDFWQDFSRLIKQFFWTVRFQPIKKGINMLHMVSIYWNWHLVSTETTFDWSTFPWLRTSPSFWNAGNQYWENSLSCFFSWSFTSFSLDFLNFFDCFVQFSRKKSMSSFMIFWNSCYISKNRLPT